MRWFSRHNLMGGKPVAAPMLERDGLRKEMLPAPMPRELPIDGADFLWVDGWGVGGLLDDEDAEVKLSRDESDDASSEATPAAVRKADDDVVCEALTLRGTGGRTLPGSSLRS